MKTKLFAIAIAALTFAGTAAFAQTEQTNVKILRTKPGYIKLLYAMEKNDLLVVRFFNENGLVGSDKIKGVYPSGLLKKYDVRTINSKPYWVEVSSPRVALTYKITPSKDGKTFESTLEKTTYTDTIVKRNN